MRDRLQYALEIAKLDENIRAVILYGSRANPNVEPDSYQDYDLVYIANDRNKFDVKVYKDVKLLLVPSKIYPDLLQDESVYLMQFSDYSRIDLTVCSREIFYKNFTDGRIMKCLLDKDSNIENLNEGDLSSSWIQPITEEVFVNTCSEFFWEIQNAVKGIKRDELSFAMFIRDIAIRDMLSRMIDTYIGMQQEYRVTVGTLGKYRKKYLTSEQYELYRSTYLSNTYEDCVKSIYSMIHLFSLLGKKIAKENGFTYPSESEKFVLQYLDHIFRNAG